MRATASRNTRFQHLVLTDVPWRYYEQTLEQIGDRHIRVNYLDGMMEIISPSANPFPEDYLTMEDVPWSYYEDTLATIGERRLQVTYCDGRIEIMSPLPEHEKGKKGIAQLVEILRSELDIPLLPLGSTTFREKKQRVGLEPDECYYIKNEPRVRNMTRFDAAVFPPPDLVIEVDVSNRSIAREPIYARLGVPEIWRYRKSKLTVRALQRNGLYRDRSSSISFPFLPMGTFGDFVNRMITEPQHLVVREFREWVRSLRPS